MGVLVFEFCGRFEVWLVMDECFELVVRFVGWLLSRGFVCMSECFGRVVCVLRFGWWCIDGIVCGYELLFRWLYAELVV